MGITIHYTGKLNSTDLIDPFCEEMEDISRSMNWKINSFDYHEEDKTPVKGLFIGPHPEAELLQFMIDKNGYLRNALMLEHYPYDNEMTFLNHTKTQFAPVEVHMAIIKLLKYIQQKYISNLEVYDEGDYWQTGDAALLKEKMDFLSEKIDLFGVALNSIPFDPKESAESIADKIEEVFRKMNFGKK
ncbi:hypothetical protein MASR2M47_13060 [Draconibacterium sp.]